MNRGPWQATVQEVTKSQTQLSDRAEDPGFLSWLHHESVAQTGSSHNSVAQLVSLRAQRRIGKTET